MANNFDEFPIFNPIIKRNTDRLSDDWFNAIATFYMNLIGYLTQYGILLPQITTEQRDSIQDPINGQLIYNTTTDTAEYYKAGSWTVI